MKIYENLNEKIEDLEKDLENLKRNKIKNELITTEGGDTVECT